MRCNPVSPRLSCVLHLTQVCCTCRGGRHSLSSTSRQPPWGDKRGARRAAYDIRSQTDDLRAEEAAATVHTPLLARAQRAGRRLDGGPGRPPDGGDASGRGGVRFRDSWKESAWDACESAVEKPADTERRRQCEEALVETLQGLARAPATPLPLHPSCLSACPTTARASARPARARGGGEGGVCALANAGHLMLCRGQAGRKSVCAGRRGARLAGLSAPPGWAGGRRSDAWYVIRSRPSTLTKVQPGPAQRGVGGEPAWRACRTRARRWRRWRAARCTWGPAPAGSSSCRASRGSTCAAAAGGCPLTS
jgi:hypothetical protein